MSVLKSKRKPSQFEVFHQLMKVRQEVTNLLLQNFGYDLERAEKRISHKFGDRDYEELTPEEKDRYDKLMKKYEAFDAWFIADERQVVKNCLRDITEYVYTANSIYPSIMEELVERRILQDKAIGQCYRLTQELQYAIETLPVDTNKYTRFAEMIQTEINLLKGWRKSDNKFKSAIKEKEKEELTILFLNQIVALLQTGATSVTAANFANVKKTRICKLSDHWRFLQIQYSLTDTGRVIQKINPKRLTAMRRKMKKLAPKLTEKEFTDFFRSWFKNHYKIMSRYQRNNIETLFNQLKEVTLCSTQSDLQTVGS